MPQFSKINLKQIFWILALSSHYLCTAKNEVVMIDCNECWKIYEKSIRMCMNFAQLASSRDNGKAGGETAAYWNTKVQDYFDKIRECCTKKEMRSRCSQFKDREIRKLCLGSMPSSPKDTTSSEFPEQHKNPFTKIKQPFPTPFNGKQEYDITPICDPRLPIWIQGYLRAAGFCRAAPTDWDNETPWCRKVRRQCIDKCARLPYRDEWEFHRCVNICKSELGC